MVEATTSAKSPRGTIQAHYTHKWELAQPGKHVQAPDFHWFDVTWERRTAIITEADGRVVFEQKNVEFPTFYSQSATDIIASKYFRKAGVPFRQREDSMRDIIVRIVTHLQEAGLNQKVFQTEEEARIFGNEMAYMMLFQIGAFNSPVWFNVGLSPLYGIKGHGDNWVWNEPCNGAVPCKDSYANPQASACFINHVEDSIEGIFDWIKTEARIFKGGSGSGVNVSTLRSKYDLLSGGGHSSGAISFLKVADSGAGSIKSGGTTRRAAKMVVMDVEHPEILDFIEWKMKEEQKAKALIAAGYSSDFNGEAYATVSGQNSNNSVSIPDSFMNGLNLSDTVWNTYKKNGELSPVSIPTRQLFSKIAEAAWVCADPGVHFRDTMNRWHTCPHDSPIRATNPCSEFIFLDDTACNLASLNLVKFLTLWAPSDVQEGRRDVFDIEAFKHAVSMFSIAQEILVDLASYPTETIAERSHQFRPLGLGYMNLGAMLMRVGLPYESEGGRAAAAAITSLMTAQAYATSAALAEQLGPFPKFQYEPMNNVIQMHHSAAVRLHALSKNRERLGAFACVMDESVSIWNRLCVAKAFRNAQMTVLAPTGTISFATDCDTTGVEPDFALVKYKKLAMGGVMKIVNESVDPALVWLGYSDDAIDTIRDRLLNGADIQDVLTDENHRAVFSCAMGKNAVTAMGHLEMIAALQPFISGGISKTINMPKETTVEDIEHIYSEAWRKGVKCVAVYRDGCKDSQPLNTKQDELAPMPELERYRSIGTPDGIRLALAVADKALAGNQWGDRKELERERTGLTLKAKVAGHKLFLRTGEYPNGRLGEIFVDMYKEGTAFRSLMNAFAQSVSVGLSYGVPLEKYVDMYTNTRFEPAGITDHPNIRTATSLLDFIFRYLGMKYLGDNSLAQIPPTPVVDAEVAHIEPVLHLKVIGEDPVTHEPLGAATVEDGVVCSTCGSLMQRAGACYSCSNCGSSSGCG